MELEPIAFVAAVEPIMMSVVIVDVLDVVAFDAVTPHPKDHNLNSTPSLPFCDNFFLNEYFNGPITRRIL